MDSKKTLTQLFPMTERLTCRSFLGTPTARESFCGLSNDDDFMV